MRMEKWKFPPIYHPQGVLQGVVVVASPAEDPAPGTTQMLDI